MGFCVIYENSDLPKDRKMTIFLSNRDLSELRPSKDVKILVESYEISYKLKRR